MSHTAPRSRRTGQSISRGRSGGAAIGRSADAAGGRSGSDASVTARLDRIPVWPYDRKLLWIVGAGYFFAFFDIVTISFAAPVIATQFHVSKGDGHTVSDEQPDRLHHRRVRRQHDRRQVGTKAQPGYLGCGVLRRHGARRGEHERPGADRVSVHRRARDRRRDRRGHHLHRRAVARAAARPLHELGHDRGLRGLRGRAVHRPRPRSDVRVRLADPVPDRRARRRDDPVHAARPAALSALARVPGTDRRGARARRRGRGDRARGDRRRSPARA